LGKIKSSNQDLVGQLLPTTNLI